MSAQVSSRNLRTAASSSLEIRLCRSSCAEIRARQAVAARVRQVAQHSAPSSTQPSRTGNARATSSNARHAVVSTSSPTVGRVGGPGWLQHRFWPVETGQQDRTADLERQLAHAWAELENLGQHVHFHGLAPDDIAAIVSRNGIPASSCIREDVRHVESSSLADAADSWPAG